MKRRVEVSVILPVHNGERFIEQAVASIGRQTLGDLELVIIDDGSTDHSPAIGAEAARRDARVTLIRQRQAGVGAALNRGLSVARGRFIARMDADDVSHPDRLATQAAFLEAHPDIAAAGSGYVPIGPDGRALAPPVLHPADPLALYAPLPRERYATIPWAWLDRLQRRMCLPQRRNGPPAAPADPGQQGEVRSVSLGRTGSCVSARRQRLCSCATHLRRVMHGDL